MLLSMMIFGTSGIFSRFVPFSAALICLVRAVIGVGVLMLVLGLRRERLSRPGSGAKVWLFLIAGAALGINWVFLYEAYRFTTVAVATLCYYIAPAFVVILSAVFLRERLTLRKSVCLLLACLGMAMVSGVLPQGFSAGGATGPLLALCAALFYATLVMLNKIAPEGISGLEKTVWELVGAVIAVLPYFLLTEDFALLPSEFSLQSGLILLWIGVVNTGLAYLLYFRSLEQIPASTAAFMSYADPVTTVLLSVLLLREPLDVWGAVGAVLVIGAGIFATERKKKRT